MTSEVRGSGGNSLFIGSTTTTPITHHVRREESNQGFCNSCSDWIVDEGWQEDGRYFCPTCLEFIEVDLVWKPGECLVHDISKNFS
jgi:hypothetical protein